MSSVILVYIELGEDPSATASLAFTFGTSTTISRYWDIRVTQIECWSPSKPYDPGCLQYFTGATGRIESFNFAQSTTSLRNHLHEQE